MLAGRRTRERSPARAAAEACSISCTDLEWERARADAERRGLSISRYLAERALTVDPAADCPSSE